MGDGARRRRTALSAIGIMTAALALSACGAPPWATGGGAAPVETATAAPTTAPAPKPVPNDLSSGSTQRPLQAGAVNATVDYWSKLSMDRWTATALKPVSMSMVTTVTPNDGQKVYLQRATMTAVPGNADQSFAPLDPQIDESSVAPGYLVLDPYSYSQTFTIGEVPPGATFVTLQFTYDFLVQTTPTSSEFAKQTASDSITVAISGGGEPEPSASS
ncbi:hypothetical protein ACO03V_12865 [Microbacterium sp. HMH0099]|uniref:hypothetical protein n=1 Tax=Microbacterium sp. HMH0099 TaxID=3414026 RepID=UPI003BF723B3